MQRYPYVLQKLTGGEPTIAVDGVYSDEAGEWEAVSQCRDEPTNGNQRPQMLPDGTLYNYTSVVYLPKGTESIANGVWVRVMDGETERFVRQVVRFERNQLGCQLWV